MRLDVKYQLGQRLKYIRKLKKLTQEEASFAMGLSKNYYCDLENAKRNPTLSILQKVARGLNISLEELFKGIDEIK